MMKTAKEVYKRALELNADLYHFHDPELIPWGLMLRLRGKKVVYDVHEESGATMLEKPYFPVPIRRTIAGLLNALEAFGAKCFNGIVASRPALMDHFPKSKTVLANNFPILGELSKDEVPAFRDRPRQACYVGGHSEDRGYREMIYGLAEIPDDFEFELLIAGPIYPDSMVDEMKSHPGFKRMKLLGMISRKEVADLLNSSRFGAVFFKPIANHVNSLPTKLFEYASAGLPTLGTDMKLWQSVIQDGGLGFVVDVTDPKAVAERYMWMTDHPDECQKIGEHAKHAVETEFNWDVESKRILELYDRILQN